MTLILNRSSLLREKHLAALRIERDRRLAASDYTQVADWPGDPVPWRAYRQALRDLPDVVADPANPDWPVPPNTA